MTRSLHAERVARKRHRCGFECGTPIERGTRYVRAALPPRTDPNTGDEWWTMALHGHRYEDCPTYGGPGEIDPRSEASARPAVAP